MKKVKNSFYLQIANALLEKKTFTLSELEGALNISWVIAKFMLRNYSEQNQFLLMSQMQD